MKTKILVYGWYGKSNLGDDLFIECFKKLFPDFDFTFTNHITCKNLQQQDAVFFGGGSFLTDRPNIDEDAFVILKQLKIFYIGVGTETQFHPNHQDLMRVAKLIATRTSVNLDSVKQINNNVTVIPDLVLCLDPVYNNKISKSVLIIPNILVVPRWNSPHWMHASWEYFKSEFSQSLDELINQGYKINFIPMCTNDYLNDQFAAIEILNKMVKGKGSFLLPKNDYHSFMDIVSKSEIVISQRYHGFILSQLANTSCLTIHHHDKLKNTGKHTLPYYAFCKADFLNKIDLIKSDSNKVMPIDRNIFELLTKSVTDLIWQV